MTRLESGALTPQNGPVDLSDIIGATIQRAAKILQNHQVEIALEANLPMVRTDMVLLEQVLFNLLDNAAKYTPEGSRIEVAAAPENGFVAVRVLDEGDGIPEADLERIFDKFYRVRRGDRQRAGTGLGLAICRGFVEAIGGRLTVANRAGRKGAVFTITLPASSVAPPPATLP
jgi:two-component system sensor histidine kinase KdpD